MATTITPRTTPEVILPTGLQYHCDACKVVVPSDAPRLDNADCAFVTKNKLAWFNPNETIKGQHTMATAAWILIYFKSLQVEGKDGIGNAYVKSHTFTPKAHFHESAARQALTPEQVEEQIALNPKRDGWAYEQGEEGK